MTDFPDVPTAIRETLSRYGSNDAQTADATLVLAKDFGMVKGAVVHIATGAEITTPEVKAWLEANKPHLLPPKFERSLADRAFIDGSLRARGELVAQVGEAEANKIAQRYGLRTFFDTRRGKLPADAIGKPNGADHSKNPWHKSNWNISKQGALLRAVGEEKAAQIAASVGSRIVATKPNPGY